MVTCPKCGTANPRGSRFCNECGEPLPLRTALRCPMCGTMNPVTNVHCDKCHARLIPMAAPRPEELEREEARISESPLPTIPREEEREPQAEDVAEQLEEVEEEEIEAQDWLAQLRASAAEEEAEEPETVGEPIEPVEIPDWLREMGPIGAEAEPTPSEEPPRTEVPLELEVEKEATTTLSPAIEETPLTPTPIPAEIPDWLQEMAPPEAFEPEPPSEAAPSAMPPPALAEIPDWLQETAPLDTAESEPPPEEAPPTTPSPVTIEIPDWLRETAPLETAEPEAAPSAVEATPPPSPIVSAPPAPSAPKPLHEIAPEAEAPAEALPEAAPSIPPPVEFPAEAETREIPDWLPELEAQPTPPPAPTAPASEETVPSPPLELEIGVAEAEGLARAEIPDWLEALRPQAAAGREPVETEGPLEGLRGVLTPTSAIKVPALRGVGVPPSEISDASLARAQFLQSLLTRPAETPQPEMHARGIRMSERVQRWLVVATLVIAVGSMLFAPLIIPRENIPTLAKPAESPAADGRMEFQRLMQTHDIIQGVHAGDAVLVAFEYGPPEADELNLVAGPVLQHLLDQGAQVSVVSTRPEGQAVAAGLLNDMVAAEQYTGHYTLLPYRASDATGVSQLLIDAGARPGLIVVLTAQPGPLRWWVEQTRALYGDALPVVAGISAALEPVASPYLDASARQLEGAINGLNGAAAYEALRGSAGRATQRLNALAVGHAAIVGLMILGAVFHALSDLRGREK